MENTIRFIKSPVFFKLTLIIFALQAIFFALAVNPSHPVVQPDGTVVRDGGVVPDGNRHIGAIYYFANQPLQNGPFITDQKDSEVWMGDLERFPSYFYYYLLSFPIRIANFFDLSDMAKVMIIRFVGIIFGLLALIVFRKIILELKIGKAIANVATAGLALTGSFAWLSPAENYDILALLFFFCFVLGSVRLFRDQDLRQLYFMAVFFFIGGITKYTYIPFMGVIGLAAITRLLYVSKRKNIGKLFKRQYGLYASKSPLIAAAAIVLFIITGGLFVERIGVNLVQYQSFDPKCVRVHSHEACMNFGVYNRDYTRQSDIESGKIPPLSFKPVEYVYAWLYRYYTSMYGYLGHIWIYVFWPGMFIGLGGVVGLLTIMTGYLKAHKRKILTTIEERAIMVTALLLVIAQFIYNLRLHLNTAGEYYAHQGRYLLPAIGLLYVLILIVVAKFLGSLPAKQRPKIFLTVLIVGVIGLITNAALPMFFIHANSPEWYNINLFGE